MISIEKAVLADICLGLPLGKIMFSVPGHLDPAMLSPAPDTFLFRGEQLSLMKTLYERGDDRIAEAVSELARSADEAIEGAPFSVVQKPRSRFSDDPHDYQSLAKYWWPNPNTDDGLPYVNRDGEVNPECYADDFDYIRLVRFSETVVLLALAAYLTGQEKYGKRAALLLETWFVNPKTRQSPHFQFGQNFPGQSGVSGQGLRWQAVIEARFLVYVTEAVRLLSGADALNPTSQKQIRNWFSDLLGWMLESEHGRKAKEAKNNIGFWYDLQCMVYAQFCGNAELADRIVHEDVVPRLNAQMAADGSLPRELDRANPNDYVAFTLAAMALIGRAGEHSGLDLWNERQGDGKNFQVAHDWLLRAGEARKLLSAVETKPVSADDEPHDLGFFLDTGVKLRAFQRIAETEARTASVLRAENERLKRKCEETEAGLQAQLAQADTLKTTLEHTRADLKAKQADLVRLRDERATSERMLAAVKQQRKELAAIAERLMKDREALLGHAEKLEARYRSVLKSTSWRAMGPLRIVARKGRSLLSGKPGRRNDVPRLPTLSGVGPGDIAARSAPAAATHSDSLQDTPRLGTRSADPASPAKRPARKQQQPGSVRSAGVADRIKALVGRNLSPGAKKVVKAALSAAPGKGAVLEGIAEAVSGVKPSGDTDPLQTLLAAQPRDEDALKKEYRDKGLDKEPDTFVLYRIVGNDLYPRHKKGQSRENVRFLLENEPELADCEKRWVVNRIIDPDEERQIVAMLEAHGQPFIHIPFVAGEYRKIGWDFDCLPAPGFLASEAFQKLGSEQQDRVRTALYRLKNNYVMHNNGARNAALRDGRARAKWVLPWDGNGFVTRKAWDEIRQAVTARPHLKYFAVPMERVTDNSMLLRDDFMPHPVEEPQVLFRRDASEEFNEDFPYGRRPKVELFWRLGIPGPWDRWKDLPWDQKRRACSSEARQFGVAGWVARMNSGADALEKKDRVSFQNRGLARQEAIVAAVDHVDSLVHAAPTDPDGLAFYTGDAFDRLATALREGGGDMLALAGKIVEDAERALGDQPYSVVQKTTLPPSGDLHDYWHPAPYWWPDPSRKDGRPYIRKDGQRVPGTRMYEPASAQYDRTRLQLMFDGTTALALGWRLTGRKDFATHGAKFVRTWFLDPDTRMNPHLRYSQVRRGHNNDEGAPTGIIEFKDLYYVLDAVRLLEKSGAFGAEDITGLKAWLREYLSWLETSRQGKKEVTAVNNHGTYFDLQTAAIAAYLGEREKLRDIFLRAQSRIAQQFTEAGEQLDEMTRSITQHYVFFNLQGWLNLFQLAKANGLPIGDWEKEPYARITEAFRWIAKHDMANWPYEQIEPFDTDRLYPLVLSAQKVGILHQDELTGLIGGTPHSQRKPIFDPHDAVRPYWNSEPFELQNNNSENWGRKIAFLIPVISKQTSKDWDLVQKNLEHTINSVLRSKNRDFLIVVCHDERPNGSYWGDERVVSLRAPSDWRNDSPRPSRDKRRKMAYAASWIRRNGWKEGHVMLLDADDLVNHNLTQFLFDDVSKSCWVVTKGIRVDVSAGKFSIVNERFHHSCGSCFIGYFYANDLPDEINNDSSMFSWITRVRHRDYGIEAASAGKLCGDVPFYAVAYMTNHRASLQNIQAGVLKRELRDRDVECLGFRESRFAKEFGYTGGKENASVQEVASVNERVSNKPEVPVSVPDDLGSAFFVHHINSERLIRAAHFPSDPQLNKDARRMGANLLAKVVEHVVKILDPDIVLEIGAHEASFSRRVSNSLPGKRIVAFEANPVVYERYKDRVIGDGVEFFNACVSNADEPILFNVPMKNDRVKATMGSILFDSQAHGHASYEVDAIVLDKFLGGVTASNAMWIDVEGAVKMVLDGAHETLKNCVALFVELETVERWPGQALAHDIIPILTDAGLVPLLTDNQREWQFNALFTRPEALRDPRIVQACADYVEGTQSPR